MTGKIIKGIAGFYYVHDGHSGIYECKAKGIFRNKNIKPLVGDNVLFEILNQEERIGNITEIRPRKNAIIRPAVANIDQAVIMFAIKKPAPNFQLLDRFLVMMEMNDIPCIICFNKSDTITGDEALKLQEIYQNTGYPLMLSSVLTGEGIEEIKTVLRGKSSVLAGSSGVGKSSLVNLLVPDAEMQTGTLSKKVGRGRHTTRHTQLFYMCENTFIFDTPGFSSLVLDRIEETDVKEYFPEFQDLEKDCRFLGCMHMAEPTCGVKDGIETGQIHPSRYESYRQLVEEIRNNRRY